jgi:hypothetical protein
VGQAGAVVEGAEVGEHLLVALPPRLQQLEPQLARPGVGEEEAEQRLVS